MKKSAALIQTLVLVIASTVSCGQDKPIPVFDVKLDTLITPIPAAESSTHPKVMVLGSIDSFAISPDLKLIALATSKGVALYDFGKQTYLQRLSGPELTVSVAWSSDGKRLAASSSIDPATVQERPHLVVWDTSTWRIIYEKYSINPPSKIMLGNIVWSPDSRSLAVFADDKSGFLDDTSVYIFNIPTGEILSHLQGFIGGATSISWSPDGQRIVCCGDVNNTFRRWNVETDKSVRLFDPRLGMPIQFAWSPDGRRIASGHYSGGICIWTVSTNDCDGFIQTDQTAVSGLAWSPDGNRLATDGGVIRIWDTNTGKLLNSFGETPGSVYPQIAWPSSGRELIEWDANQGMTYVRVWDANSGSVLFEFNGLE